MSTPDSNPPCAEDTLPIPPLAEDDDRDRRTEPRVRLDVAMAVPVRVRSDLGVHNGTARNISEGGMLLELEEAPPIGSSIEITIANAQGHLVGPGTLTLMGEVRHHVAWSYIGRAGQSRLRGVGIRFTGASRAPEPSGPLH